MLMTEQERQDLEKTRDMFANTAMTEHMRIYDIDVPHIVKFSYDYADAMIEEKLKRLKERKKLNHPANVNETKGIDSMGEWE